jgi:hypothetical protein
MCLSCVLKSSAMPFVTVLSCPVFAATLRLFRRVCCHHPGSVRSGCSVVSFFPGGEVSCIVAEGTFALFFLCVTITVIILTLASEGCGVEMRNTSDLFIVITKTLPIGR